MAKQIEGVAERIICAAKEEFLDKGYVDASLRAIAAAAGTSTIPFMSVSATRRGFFRPLSSRCSAV